MSEHAFQFAVLRYVHDIITQEFINVGIVVYSREQRYIKARVSQRYSRLSDTFQSINGEFYRRLVGHIERAFLRMHQEFQHPKLKELDDFPAQIEIALQRVLPPDESALRFGGIGGGITEDLDVELNHLYERLVERYIEAPERPSRDDKEVWHVYREEFDKRQIGLHLRPVTIVTPTYEYAFDHAWKNERWHPIEPVSFDLLHESSIREKATHWIGRTITLADSDDLGKLYLLLGSPPQSNKRLYDAYEKAKINLQEKIQLSHRIVEEEEAEEFSKELAGMMKGH